MKKIIPTAILAVATLVYADGSMPLPISTLNQYMNTLASSPASTYEQLKEDDKNLNISLDVYLSDTYNIVNIPISYVYNNKFGVSLYGSYLESSVQNQEDENGIGDTTVEISFNAGQFQDDVEYENNIFGLRYTFSSGDEEKNLGAGYDSVSIFWDSIYILNDDWTIYGSLLWTFYFDDVVMNNNLYELGSEDILWAGFKHKCLLTDKVDTLVKLNWQGKYTDIPDYSFDLVDITLQWESDKLINSFPVHAGVKIPVWDSGEIDNEFLFFVGISKMF
jgi:hypothetical protein